MIIAHLGMSNQPCSQVYHQPHPLGLKVNVVFPLKPWDLVNQMTIAKELFPSNVYKILEFFSHIMSTFEF
jgi:hypothetical protein